MFGHHKSFETLPFLSLAGQEAMRVSRHTPVRLGAQPVRAPKSQLQKMPEFILAPAPERELS
jgi:hypothetical protein